MADGWIRESVGRAGARRVPGDLDEGRGKMSKTIILDFVMLNALRETYAAEAALGQASGALRVALGTKE